MVAKGFAPAKVNLTLHITGQRQDGFHLLDSLVAFADVGDVVDFRAASELSLTVSGPQAAGVPADNGNLVLRAARLMGIRGGRFGLEKALPAAAGIGGGSSDAAATLRLLSQSTDRPIPTETIALGADVPVCVEARATRMSGIGEMLNAVPALPPMPAVLVNPGVRISTPDVFRALTRRENSPMPDRVPVFAKARECALWLSRQRNDLEPAAVAIAPVISTVLEVLQAQPGNLLARMSGSGATCFALFEDDCAARAAASALQSAMPRWWVRACRLS